jgi:hypothetical protein
LLKDVCFFTCNLCGRYAAAECTRRVTRVEGSGGGEGYNNEDDEDEGGGGGGSAASHRRLLLSSVWRVYAALWEAELGGTFDCSVLGVIRDAQDDAAARAKGEADLAAALERVEVGGLHNSSNI